MSLTNEVRDIWCRFLGELFPDLQTEIGILPKISAFCDGA